MPPTDPMTPQRLRVGDVVKLSALAIQQGWYPIERVRIEPDQIRGVVTATPNTGSVYVRWNLYKTSEYYPQAKANIGLERVAP